MKRNKIIISLLTGTIMIFADPHQSADGLVSETPLSAFRFLAGIIAAGFIVYAAMVLRAK